MSIFYKVAYRIGVTPWEDASETHGDMIERLIKREETGSKPYGPVLDLGCGSGFWSVKMAQWGWQVVGIDNIPKALERARKRAKTAGVDVSFLFGDVTRLHETIGGSKFNFFLDLGCFHSLKDNQRIKMGIEVNNVAAPDATILELVWKRHFRGPLPRGANPEELEKIFAGWKVIAEDPIDASALPGFLKNADPRCYLLRKGN